MYLLDTNVLSEIRKIGKNKANKNVELWATNIDGNKFFISTITLLEQRKWVLSARNKKDEAQALSLENWLDNVIINFDGRILPVTNEISLLCAELHIPNPRPAFDSLIASTALVHDLTLVTRNEKDFVDIDNLRILNPFSNH